MTNSFSAGHEREECRKMNRGFWHSLFGILFCLVPGLGLLFAISGFFRQMVRMTRKHRFRNVVFTIIALISLITCVGVLAWEAYEFSQDPKIVDKIAHQAWEAVTGQKEFPWAEVGYNDDYMGIDYGGYGTPGLGQFDEDGYMDYEGEGYYQDDLVEIDLDSLPDVETIMDEMRHPFAQYGF